MFDFANTFLAGLNPSLSVVLIYQSLESMIGVLFNLFGGVIADSFKRKKKNYYYYKISLMWYCLPNLSIYIPRKMVGLCDSHNKCHFGFYECFFSGPSYKSFLRKKL